VLLPNIYSKLSVVVALEQHHLGIAVAIESYINRNDVKAVAIAEIDYEKKVREIGS
jgi:hypothetical protein